MLLTLSQLKTLSERYSSWLSSEDKQSFVNEINDNLKPCLSIIGEYVESQLQRYHDIKNGKIEVNHESI